MERGEKKEITHGPPLPRRLGTTRERYAATVAGVEDRVAGELGPVLGNLLQLANGEARVVQEEWVAAGTLLVEQEQTDAEGQPLRGRGGRPVRAKVALFPDRAADEMVLVKRKETRLAPSDRVNIYLTDRILERLPTPTVPDDLTRDEISAIIKKYVRDPETLQALASALDHAADAPDGDR